MMMKIIMMIMMTMETRKVVLDNMIIIHRMLIFKILPLKMMMMAILILIMMMMGIFVMIMRIMMMMVGVMTMMMLVNPTKCANIDNKKA